MARRKNPIDKLKDAAFDAIKDPVGTAGKAVEQAKGTAAIGKIGRGSGRPGGGHQAAQTVGAVAERTGRPRARPRPRRPRCGRCRRWRTAPSDRQRAGAGRGAAESQGDPVVPAHADAAETPAAAKKAPAKKASAKKAATKAPAKKRRARPRRRPPRRRAKKTAKKAAKKTATPADAAKQVAKKGPAKKSARKAAKKAPAKTAASPGDRLPTERRPPQQAPAAPGPPSRRPTWKAWRPDAGGHDGCRGGDQPRHRRVRPAAARHRAADGPGHPKAAVSEAETELSRAADPDKG